jgi:aminopeptidase N
MGYYRSSFPHPDSKDKKETYYALTQFEPTAARRAYPAWDEPAIKATYRVGLVGRKGLVSLGNMPVESEGEWKGEKGVGFFLPSRIRPRSLCPPLFRIHLPLDPEDHPSQNLCDP